MVLPDPMFDAVSCTFILVNRLPWVILCTAYDARQAV